MGNCVFKGFGEVEEMVKVVTSDGGIMELYAPITAECITNEFPGHGIFRSQYHNQDDFLLSAPLLHKEELHAGRLYYLLPLNNSASNIKTSSTAAININNNSLPSMGAAAATPYRMSFDNHEKLLNRSSEAAAEVFPRYNSTGVWKVRLVINPEQLSEILSQETRNEALIESVRTVVKCGTTTIGTSGTSGVSSVAANNSDKWSVSS